MASDHPTIFLPPLVRLTSHSTQTVGDALQKLRTLYWPPPLPPQITLPKRTLLSKIHDTAVPDSGYASAEEEEEEDDDEATFTHVVSDSDRLDAIRADILERQFAVRWTTGFIGRSDAWIEVAPAEEQDARTQLIDDATALLSAFIGDETTENDAEDDEDEPDMVRVVSFPTIQGPSVEVHLHDAPMLDDDHTSVGLQSWGSCIRFGKRICKNPSYFSLPPSPADTPDRPLRVLELGAGTGLLSILAAKLLRDASLPPTIIATDFHPDVLANLKINVKSNLPSSSSSSSNTPSTPLVQVQALDWAYPNTAAPFDTPFDVILAADVIYHPQHAFWIRGCVEKLLRRPTSSQPAGGVFWMFNAVREVGRHEGLAESVEMVFDGSAPLEKTDGEENMGLEILEMEQAEKEAGVGRVDESGYKLFRIGWVRDGVKS